MVAEAWGWLEESFPSGRRFWVPFSLVAALNGLGIAQLLSLEPLEKTPPEISPRDTYRASSPKAAGAGIPGADMPDIARKAVELGGAPGKFVLPDLPVKTLKAQLSRKGPDKSAADKRPMETVELWSYDWDLTHQAMALIRTRHNDKLAALLDKEGVKSLSPEGVLTLIGEWDNFEALDILIAHGFDINQRKGMGRVPLAYRGVIRHPRLVDRLMERGADFQAIDERGGTVLMAAAAWGDLETLKKFVRLGLDPFATDHSLLNALDRLQLAKRADDGVERYLRGLGLQALKERMP